LPALSQALRVMRSYPDDLICGEAGAVKRVTALKAKCLEAATCAFGYTKNKKLALGAQM
jgi:hypothetical protein